MPELVLMPAPVMMTILRDLASVSATFWRRSRASGVTWRVGMVRETVGRGIWSSAEHGTTSFNEPYHSSCLLRKLG
ncbi:hypothetical protein F5Y07DRAFT_365155 [Xylaria sp. FL0933]|nr:hypothetical protein F5Y07DRAFT_365155 [Xylaria sp. FL0933]